MRFSVDGQISGNVKMRIGPIIAFAMSNQTSLQHEQRIVVHDKPGHCDGRRARKLCRRFGIKEYCPRRRMLAKLHTGSIARIGDSCIKARYRQCTLEIAPVICKCICASQCGIGFGCITRSANFHSCSFIAPNCAFQCQRLGIVSEKKLEHIILW